jgi:hypothetical protein
MQPEGMYAEWVDDQGHERSDYTYLIGRHKRWPMKRVPIIIGEWGIEGILYNRHRDPVYGNAGWRNFPELWSPERYADEYVECIRQAADNVIAICPFLSDYADRRWMSADLAPAYGAFLARKELCVKETTHLPNISTGPTPVSTAYVQVRDGANIRTRPVDGAILTAVPYGEKVSVIGYDNASQWFQVQYNGVTGWTLAALLDESMPEQAPVETVPQPTAPSNEQAAWERSIAFVLKEEGGLSTDKNDPGNYVDGVFVGTNFGISANAHPGVDIVNLTVEQAKQIYYTSYWIPSGASTLPWPMCLAVMDLAVNGGVGRAKEALAATGPNFLKYMSWRIDWYTRIKNFNIYGVAWIRRCARLMMEAAK